MQYNYEAFSLDQGFVQRVLMHANASVVVQQQQLYPAS